MKINNSSDFDLDLFFGNNIFLMHFATAGLQVNDEIFFSSSHNNFRNFLKNFSQTRFEYKLNPFLEEIISSKRETNPNFDFELYTADFITYAKFGLFSFDRTFIGQNDDNNFHLVAYPILNDSYNNLINNIYNVNINLDYNLVNEDIVQSVNNYFKRSFNSGWNL